MKLQRRLLQVKFFRSVFPALLLAVVLSVAGSAFGEKPQPPANNSQIPIAFASISYNGALQSGTSNVRTSYNRSTGLYQIKIAGVCFLRTSFSAVATVSGYNGWPKGALFVNTDDDGHFCHETGAMVVGLRDVNGNLVQADFQVVVFKAK